MAASLSDPRYGGGGGRRLGDQEGPPHSASVPPWFLRSNTHAGGDAQSHERAANVAEVTVVAEEDAGDCGSFLRRFALDVPRSEFEKMLERASRHRGYSGRQRDVHETVTRDTILQTWEDEGGRQQARVVRRHLVEARTMDGTPLLVRTYRREALPFSAFPCDAPVQSRRRVRRLELRVHRRARLVFEVSAAVSCADETDPSSASGGACTHRVRLEVELTAPPPPPRGGNMAVHDFRGSSGNAEDAELADLRRTVENTIQVVLMGMPPQGKGVQLGSSRR